MSVVTVVTIKEASKNRSKGTKNRRSHERRKYHLFQFPAINHEALRERGKRRGGRGGVAWCGMVWQASEGGSIALIFHDLSHSLLAFRERRAGGRGYEGEREEREERQAAAQSIKGVP